MFYVFALFRFWILIIKLIFFSSPFFTLIFFSLLFFSFSSCFLYWYCLLVLLCLVLFRIITLSPYPATCSCCLIMLLHCDVLSLLSCFLVITSLLPHCYLHVFSSLLHHYLHHCLVIAYVLPRHCFVFCLVDVSSCCFVAPPHCFMLHRIAITCYLVALLRYIEIPSTPLLLHCFVTLLLLLVGTSSFRPLL